MQMEMAQLTWTQYNTCGKSFLRIVAPPEAPNRINLKDSDISVTLYADSALCCAFKAGEYFTTNPSKRGNALGIEIPRMASSFTLQLESEQLEAEQLKTLSVYFSTKP
jgi:hypothetical protein